MRLRAAFESRRAPVIWLLAAAMLTGACSSNEAGPDDTTGVGTGSGGLGGDGSGQ